MDTQTEKRKHSKLGVTAFVLSLLSPILFIAAAVAVLISLGHASTPADQALQEILVKAGIIAFFSPFILAPLALVLGIAGLLQKKCKKIFALLGVLTSIPICLFIFV